MRFLVVDDEIMLVNEMVSVLHRIRPEDDVIYFTWPEDALKAAAKIPIDVAFLDIQMSGMNGLQMAIQLKKIKPDTQIIFVTGFSQYAVDAFALHATGYLLKPVTDEAVNRELTFIYGERRSQNRIQIKTFGGFDMYVDGNLVRFNRTKSKELLAYLVDHKGSSVTTGDAYAALFEDAADTLSGKSYFRTILHEMINSLKKVDADDIILKERNSYAVIPGKFECDFYRFLQGDPIAVNAYQNDYMPAYSWAEIRNAELGMLKL